ncbi:hypothetical protein TDB9533_01979 [Thalassocella blandensis]|nr:hypothetical protein TDB9533_01979 [Thalassocella blandensis]
MISQKFRQTAWYLHHWVGLKLCIFMSFVLFTGSLAVVSNEIDWLLHKGMRAPVYSGSIEWNAMAKAIHRYAPEAEILSLNAPVDRGFAPYAMVRLPDKSLRLYFHDPGTGVLQGDYNYMTVQRALRFLHRHLFLPTKIGVPIVSSLAFLLLISLVTAFVIYKNWWKGFFRFPTANNARRWLVEFHRVAGVWSLWFITLMVLTGVWYFVESLGGRAVLPNVKVEQPVMETGAAVMALDDNLHSAQLAFPGLKIKRIIFPSARNSVFAFHGEFKAVLVRPRANAVVTDAETSEVLLTSDGREFSLHQRISEMADPLHFGYFGGLATKSIWFVFGLLLTSLSLSGAAIVSSRMLKKARQDLSVKNITLGSFAPMMWWKWLASVPVFVGLVLLVCKVVFGMSIG